MTVTFSTKLPCIICLKKLCFCFSYAKSRWNWAAGFFTFLYPGRINLFSPHQNVSLWKSEAETFQIWALASLSGCDNKWKTLLCMSNIYMFYPPQKPLIFHLCVPCPFGHVVLADLHLGDHQLRCFHIQSGAPVGLHGSWCGIPAQHAQEER